MDHISAGVGALALELLDAAFPRRCFLCGAEARDGFACAAHAIERDAETARCGRCAAPLPRGVPDGLACGACRRDPPAFARAVCAADYRSSAVREWILRFKHGGRPDLAWPLGVLLARELEERGLASLEGAVLVPVPLHPLRRFERGYDQARLLAESAARASGLAAVRALARSRRTPPQGAPGALSRTANVRDAFRPARWGARRVADRTVVLVDDVVTSGATADACARELRRLGSGEVVVACVARAGGTDAEGGTMADA